MDLSERLARLYSGAVYDVLRAMGHDNCVLPPGIVGVNPEHRLAGQAWTINGFYQEGQDAQATLLPGRRCCPRRRPAGRWSANPIPTRWR